MKNRKIFHLIKIHKEKLLNKNIDGIIITKIISSNYKELLNKNFKTI